MPKTVHVVDEAGNRYEATYLKRAQGLVKKGRARFIDENTICLVCPPNQNLEDNVMEDNRLTAKEIFVQLTLLQKQLTESSYTSLHHLDDAITSIGEENDGARYEQITEVCDVFKTRELNLLKILELYERMYHDIQNEDAKKVDLVKSAFDSNMAMINQSAMKPEDKADALAYVANKIAELVEKIVVN